MSFDTINNIFNKNISALFVPKRAIGQFTATVTIEENSTDIFKITQHPIQSGSAVNDHAFLESPKLELRIAWGQSLTPLSETYQNLLNLQKSREPFVVVTGKRKYENMLFEKLGVVTNKDTENVLMIYASLIQITIVTVETIKTADKGNQKNYDKTAITEKVATKSLLPESILHAGTGLDFLGR